MKLAPITLFVYDRVDHTRRTIDALKKNLLAKESELFIFSDGTKTPNDLKVRLVRDYIRTIDGFKKVTIIESPKNKGLSESIINGVTKIVHEHGQIIVLEDDLLTSPYFLNYMNDALRLYEKDDQVACISGYTYPIEGAPETFFIRGADCWGWATWKRGWSVFDQDGQRLLDKIDRKGVSREFDFYGGMPHTKMLKEQIQGENDSWAVRWLASAFLTGRLCLYPKRSLVVNAGWDGSGTHCGTTDEFDAEPSGNPVEVIRIPLEENRACRKKFESYFKRETSQAENFLFKKIKTGNRRIIVFLNRFKISYARW